MNGGLVASLTAHLPLLVGSNQPRKRVDVVGMRKKVKMGETRVEIQALRAEQGNILQRITGGQSTTTGLSGKMSGIPLRIQTKMPDRCTEGRLEKGIRPPPVETELLEAPAVPKAG